jgi:DNA-binding IscR family transcriptional regulator
MKISTKGRYGLRAMLDLALNARGEHESLNSIATRQNISENYMEQVFFSS